MLYLNHCQKTLTNGISFRINHDLFMFEQPFFFLLFPRFVPFSQSACFQPVKSLNCRRRYVTASVHRGPTAQLIHMKFNADIYTPFSHFDLNSCLLFYFGPELVGIDEFEMNFIQQNVKNWTKNAKIMNNFLDQFIWIFPLRMSFDGVHWKGFFMNELDRSKFKIVVNFYRRKHGNVTEFQWHNLICKELNSRFFQQQNLIQIFSIFFFIQHTNIYNSLYINYVSTVEYQFGLFGTSVDCVECLWWRIRRLCTSCERVGHLPCIGTPVRCLSIPNAWICLVQRIR